MVEGVVERTRVWHQLSGASHLPNLSDDRQSPHIYCIRASNSTTTMRQEYQENEESYAEILHHIFQAVIAS